MWPLPFASPEVKCQSVNHASMAKFMRTWLAPRRIRSDETRPDAFAAVLSVSWPISQCFPILPLFYRLKGSVFDHLPPLDISLKCNWLGHFHQLVRVIQAIPQQCGSVNVTNQLFGLSLTTRADLSPTFAAAESVCNRCLQHNAAGTTLARLDAFVDVSDLSPRGLW